MVCYKVAIKCQKDVIKFLVLLTVNCVRQLTVLVIRKEYGTIKNQRQTIEEKKKVVSKSAPKK